EKLPSGPKLNVVEPALELANRNVMASGVAPPTATVIVSPGLIEPETARTEHCERAGTLRATRMPHATESLRIGETSSLISRPRRPASCDGTPAEVRTYALRGSPIVIERQDRKL